jgi:hypothetical protein
VWNVSGFQAVELTLKDGSRFRIGTDEPEALVHAIELSMKAGSGRETGPEGFSRQ